MELFEKAKFLEVGKVYADAPKDSKYTTYLKFVGKHPIESDCLLFEYDSGHIGYIRNQDGLIEFQIKHQKLSDNVFYSDAVSFFIPNYYPL